MSNRFNMSCPKCGDEDHIDISGFVTLRLSPTGVEPRDFEPDCTSENGAECAACGYVGTVKEFETPTGLALVQ
jgi:hypothetical protein